MGSDLAHSAVQCTGVDLKLGKCFRRPRVRAPAACVQAPKVYGGECIYNETSSLAIHDGRSVL